MSTECMRCSSLSSKGHRTRSCMLPPSPGVTYQPLQAVMHYSEACKAVMNEEVGDGTPELAPRAVKGLVRLSLSL